MMVFYLYYKKRTLYYQCEKNDSYPPQSSSYLCEKLAEHIFIGSRRMKIIVIMQTNADETIPIKYLRY